MLSFSEMQKVFSLARTLSTIGAALSARNVIAPALPTKLIQQRFCTIQNNDSKKILAPTSPMINLVCGFKIKGRVRRRCKDCYFVVRDGRMHVICPKHPRHKQKAMRKKPHNTWILTHASQSPVRPWWSNKHECPFTFSHLYLK